MVRSPGARAGRSGCRVLDIAPQGALMGSVDGAAWIGAAWIAELQASATRRSNRSGHAPSALFGPSFSPASANVGQRPTARPRPQLRGERRDKLAGDDWQGLRIATDSFHVGDGK